MGALPCRSTMTKAQHSQHIMNEHMMSKHSMLVHKDATDLAFSGRAIRYFHRSQVYQPLSSQNSFTVILHHLLLVYSSLSPYTSSCTKQGATFFIGVSVSPACKQYT